MAGFRGPAGHKLYYTSWTLPRSRGLLLVLPGLGDHGGRYGAVARTANGCGLNAHALDLRGHGRSSGKRGHAGSLTGLVEDVESWRKAISAGCEQRLTYVFGHSLGGLIALRYLQSDAGRNSAGGILVAPFLGLAMPVPGWKRLLGRWAEVVYPSLTLNNGIRLEDQFRDGAEREVFRDDQRTHRRVSARLYSEMLRAAQSVRSDASRLRGPLLFQVPLEDRIVRSRATLELAEHLGERASSRTYAGAYHDLYRDPQRDKALSDLASWLEAGLGGRLAGAESKHE